jgi:hypothetical protein
MTKSTTTQSSKLSFLLANPTSQLYNLEDISTTRTWDYSLPTITTRRRFTDRLNSNSDESFFQIFKDVNTGLPYRILEHAGVFRHKNDIVLFGGCLLDIVLGRGDSIRDYDLRLVGDEYMNDEAKCVAKAKEFVASIFSFVAKDNENVDQQIALAKEEGRDWNRIAKCNVQEIIVSRARSTVSIHIPCFGNTWSTTFQLTFAPVQTVKDLLGACQPHCTRLAVADGAVVLGTVFD